MNRVIANNRPVLPDEPVDNVTVDVVKVNVVELADVEMIVKVIRHADHEILQILWLCREKRPVLLVRRSSG